MASTRKSKPSRETSAAYAASQPLFDALRSAVSRIDEQRKQLEIARDIVQSLHVKLAADGQAEYQNAHVRYIHAVVKASRSASQSFANVFEELAKLTAAEPDEGKEERQEHHVFTTMGTMAKAIEDGAEAYLSQNEQRAFSVSPLLDDEGRDEVEMRDVGESEDNKDAAEGGRVEDEDIHAMNGQQHNKMTGTTGAATPNVPLRTLNASEETAWKAERARQKREKRREKRRHLKREKAGAQVAVNGQQSGLDPDVVGLDGGVGGSGTGVQYDDMSAEVDARLKAKEEARASKKKERKRKRESVDSFDAGAALTSETQSKKKTKSGGAEEQVPKKHSRPAEGAADESSRKRKKTKG